MRPAQVPRPGPLHQAEQLYRGQGAMDGPAAPASGCPGAGRPQATQTADPEAPGHQEGAKSWHFPSPAFEYSDFLKYVNAFIYFIDFYLIKVSPMMTEWFDRHS